MRQTVLDLEESKIREVANAGMGRGDVLAFWFGESDEATPEFIRDIRKNVDPTASLNDLVSFRIHGVSPEFVREVAALGYDDVDPDDLVAMRIHGVSPSFIRSIWDTGLKPIDLDELVSFRIHGVDAEFIKEATAAGVQLDPDDLVSYRIHERKPKRRP